VDRHQIRDLHQCGHVIGTHSRTHPDRMSHLNSDALIREWADSRAELSDIIGEPVKVASVPGGYYSRRVARAAAAAGIEVLFTSEPTGLISSVDGCLILGRYSVRHSTHPRTTGALSAGVAWARRQQAAMWLAKKAIKRIAGPWYGTIRRMLLARVPYAQEN
jgi:peptidoglycan/xylan/chitin deacetylase (PgdA/CDA1 family)